MTAKWLAAAAASAALLTLALLATEAEAGMTHSYTNRLNKTLEGGKRDSRFLSMFQVVRFRNEPCNATNEKGGTCYTSQECEDKGGEASGTCAESFGVCCVFSLGCGKQTSENCTYFEVGNPDAGSCRLDVCSSNNICQLRLDFEHFSITGPSSSTIESASVTSGLEMPSGDETMTMMTQCMTDTFAVSVGGQQQRPPTLCGLNTGEHMYVDRDSNCNTLSFKIHRRGIEASLPASRGWSIKISQYSCDYNNLAPDSCTQYFWGDDNGVVRSYNYNGGIHLANQRQKFCVRQEKNICKLCWAATSPDDFQVSDDDTDSGTTGSYCCGYGDEGTSYTGPDCLTIPGYVETDDGSFVEGNSFCGRRLDPLDSTSNTVCQFNQAFSATFYSDNWEEEDEADLSTGNKGLQLAYIQVPC